jgi:rod shape-determining protein MreB
MPGLIRELGIDLGTAHIVLAEGAQILVNEPTVVAIVVNEQKIVEWGQAASDMFGRVPDTMEVSAPLEHGVIAEYEVTEALLQYIVRKVAGSMMLFRPRLMLTVPYGITSVEMRAVHEAGLGAGSRDVYLIQQPLAAALGLEMPISSPSGNMVICLGGGVNQAAVLAMNSIVSAEMERTGGLSMDDAIVRYVRKKYGVIIGPRGAEQIKLRIGAAVPLDEPLTTEVQGQDQVTGLPRSFAMTSNDVVEALEEPLASLVGLVRRLLEKTPPELVADVIDRGAALCGGGALLRGINRFLTRSLGIPVYLVDNPTTCTALGASRALSMREALYRSLVRV